MVVPLIRSRTWTVSGSCLDNGLIARTLLFPLCSEWGSGLCGAKHSIELVDDNEEIVDQLAWITGELCRNLGDEVWLKAAYRGGFAGWPRPQRASRPWPASRKSQPDGMPRRLLKPSADRLLRHSTSAEVYRG